MKVFLESRNTGLFICTFIIVLTIISDLMYYLPYMDELFGVDNIARSKGNNFLDVIFNINYGPQCLIIALITLFGVYILANKKIALIIAYPIYLSLLHRNMLFQDGSNNIIESVLPFVILYYIIGYIFPKKNYKNAFLGAILVQICIVYLFTGIGKLMYPIWYEGGAALYYALNTDFASVLAINKIISENDVLLCLMTYSTLLFEGTFAFLVWFRKTKLPILLIGIMFHIGIYFLLRIEDFSWVMIATYFLFVTDKEYNFFYHKLKGIKLKKPFHFLFSLRSNQILGTRE